MNPMASIRQPKFSGIEKSRLQKGSAIWTIYFAYQMVTRTFQIARTPFPPSGGRGTPRFLSPGSEGFSSAHRCGRLEG